MTDYKEIKRLAKCRRIPLTGLSEAVGLWRCCFETYEKENIDIPWGKLRVIAEILRVDPERLVRFDQEID